MKKITIMADGELFKAIVGLIVAETNDFTIEDATSNVVRRVDTKVSSSVSPTTRLVAKSDQTIRQILVSFFDALKNNEALTESYLADRVQEQGYARNSIISVLSKLYSNGLIVKLSDKRWVRSINYDTVRKNIRGV